MAYIEKLFNTNFLEYASYVVKERAIPHLDDGFKPVQRRIIQSLIDKDDGKFHKVANIVGHAMQYHPHGDASIYEALVNLANKELFIDRQGNFGNIFTGDPASASRYIECRLNGFAKDILYNPEITEYTPSYDGRRDEPVVFPAKIPILLILGTEGIAVGMATRILPHNFTEVLEAVKSSLLKEPYEIFPDFPTAGLIDVTGYNEGNGKIISRAKIDTSDPKRIVITEVPFGTNTESLIASIESAAHRNKIKIGMITDFTTDKVEIEIKLPRNIHTDDVVAGLFAFTDCENSISVNLLVIHNERPVQMTVPMVIDHHAGRLTTILKAELELEKRNLLDRLHARTLERVFIEEGIYKRIETMKTMATIFGTIREGFLPFKNEIKREITDEDIERLLKIPIRRISLYDIDKMKKEMDEIKARIKEINYHLKNLTEYAISFIDGILEKAGSDYKRKTEILSIKRVDIRDAAQRNLKLRYNKDTGYLGYGVATGSGLFDVSVYDRILVVKKDASYFVCDVPEKSFIGKGILYCEPVNDETLENTVYTIIFKNNETQFPYIKRCKITQFIKDKSYDLVPEGGSLLKFTVKEDVSVVVDFKQKTLKLVDEYFPVNKYLVKGVKAGGVRIKNKECNSAKFIKTKTLEEKEN